MVPTAKIASMAIIFILSCISGIIPCLTLKCTTASLQSSKTFKLVLSLLTCFSGGVFFATSMLNLFPAAQDAMDKALIKLNLVNEFPFTESLIGIGFILVLFIETTALACCSNHHIAEENNDTTDMNNDIPDMNNVETTSNGFQMNGMETTGGVQSVSQNVPTSNFNDARIVGSVNTHATLSIDASVDGDSDVIEYKQPKGIAKLRIIVLMFALSIHMVFDGLAIGLLGSDSQVWPLLLPICIHKLLVFFSVGLAISETLDSMCHSVITLIFISLVSPVGIVVGIILSMNNGGVVEETVSAVLQGLAVGTFFYVTFFEILQREFNTHTKHGVKRAFSTALGYVVMVVIKYLIPE